MVVATSVWTDVLFQKDTQGQKEKHLPIKASAARSHIANKYCSRQANEKANTYS